MQLCLCCAMYESRGCELYDCDDVCPRTSGTRTPSIYTTRSSLSNCMLRPMSKLTIRSFALRVNDDLRTILDESRRKLRGGSDVTNFSRAAQYRLTLSVQFSAIQFSSFNSGSVQFSSAYSLRILPTHVCVCVCVCVCV